MALPHAILVSLCEQSGSGYELTRRFDRSIGYFWSATHQQIYRTLRTMEADGWVSAKVVAQQGRPDKKVYTVSPTGHAEVRRWLAEPVEPSPMRSEIAVKLRGASLGDVRALAAAIARHRDLHAIQLDAVLAMAKKDFADPARLSGRELHHYLVLRGGIHTEQGLVDWYEEILQALEGDA